MKYLFIIALLFLLFPTAFYRPPVEGLDASYIIAINLALKNHFLFGKDIVFTFGPLAVLDGRFPIGVDRWVYLVTDIYFFTTLFFLLKRILSSGLGVSRGCFIAVGFILALFESNFQWYFLFYVFYLFDFIKNPRKKTVFLQAALLSILCFYYKLNLGLTAVLLFVAALHYVLIRRKITFRYYAVLFPSYVLSLLVFARLLNVDLWGYTIGSGQLIDSYNDAMYLPAGKTVLFLRAALLILLLFALRCIYLLVGSIGQKATLKYLDELFIHGITAGVLFMLFKSSFVRMDNKHLYHFFTVISLPIAFLYLYTPAGLDKRVADISYGVILGIACLASNTIPGVLNIYRVAVNRTYLAAALHKPVNYYRGWRDYPEAEKGPARPGTGYTELKKIIGAGSVDVIPSEISTLYFNGLRYNPRPVIQSYSVFNAYLDNLNYEKYMSPDAPDYILFSLGSIDDRYPFFDETKTKLAIFSHYVLAGETDGELLLRKKSTAVLPLLKEESIISGRLGEDIPLKDYPGIQYAKIFVRYTFRGRIRRWLYQPPPLRITLILEKGERMTYRAIPTMLEDGVLLGKYIESRQDFQYLLLSGGRAGTPIKKIRIEEDPGIGGFVDDIKIINSFYTFPPKTEPEREKDSLEILKLDEETNQFKPSPEDTAAHIPDSFRCWIENTRTSSPLIRIQGWAFREQSGPEHPGVIVPEHPGVKVLLRSGTTVYSLPSENRDRPDVTDFFNLKNTVVEGFSARVAKSQLPAGDYQIGILLYDSTRQKKWVRYTNNRIQR